MNQPYRLLQSVNVIFYTITRYTQFLGDFR